MVRWLGAVSLALLFVAATRAQQAPLIGRPTGFSGAIGSYRVETRAEPTLVHAEEPIRFIVRIISAGPLRGVRRPDLSKLPRFARQFHIENVDERDLPEHSAREFEYLLRPRSANVTEIPSLPFIYFKPGFLPEHKGFQTATAPPIPIIVKPRATLAPLTDATMADDLPEFLYHQVPVDRLLQGQSPVRVPGLMELLILLSLPPAGCCLLNFVRRRCLSFSQLAESNPAAQKAATALSRLQTSPSAAWADAVAAIVGEYFQARLGCTVSELTPQELADFLRCKGADEGLINEAVRFLCRCDVLRFAPGQPRDEGLLKAAQDLLAVVEKQSWLGR